MRVALIPSLLALLVACASGGAQRPANAPRPELDINVTNVPFFGSGYEAPMGFAVLVTNTSGAPIVVRSIRVSSPGMAQYTIRPSERRFMQKLAPGESKELLLSAMAVTGISGLQPTEPLTLRVDAYYDGSGTSWRELYQFNNIGL